MSISRRVLLVSSVSAAAVAAAIFIPRSADINGRLVTDPEGLEFGYADGWIVAVR